MLAKFYQNNILKKPSLILVLLLICLISCDRPECKNENPIFEAYEPNSKKYKDELDKLY